MMMILNWKIYKMNRKAYILLVIIHKYLDSEIIFCQNCILVCLFVNLDFIM